MADGGSARKLTLAQRADLHETYEAAVQAPDVECEFILNTYRKIRGRAPQILREDFCGTASISCEWVKAGPRRRAIGVDLDPDVLESGRRRHLARLTPGQRERVQLVTGDVSRVRTDKVDAIGAFNFSYWVFKTRESMLKYFRQAHRALATDGVLFLDAFGGYEACQELRETTKFKGFTYVWHQEKYYPVTGDILCHIDFRFPDGSKIEKAFTYDWRLWTLPELRELLTEAGFSRVTVWWEGTGKDGTGNGVFAPETRGEADAGWVAYLIAER
ncbi:MAG: class I SAM-dependent methyltransferase [Gammaproteobacteria bacterium]